MIDLKKNDNSGAAKSGKTYITPKLEVFGEVSALTASGSIIGMENGSMATTEMG
ncbi:hypothetical protein [uncultured Mameliella sp.]|uniref:hypothetical protein n=1 Tax=uncultured Mameliella sp. TaxID=1447087 RepID=UPI00263011C2|nr:hypothetical protein [uncultured Mameliella sp.]